MRKLQSIGLYKDKRLERREALFREALISSKQSSINEIGKTWGEKLAYYRFLRNEKVTEGEIIRGLQERTRRIVKGKNILVLVDTTEVNCSTKNNRIKEATGLGVLSDNKTMGFLMHPQYVIEEDSKTPLGIAGVKLWGRAKREQWPKEENRKREITEKETDKWYSEIKKTRDDILSESNRIIYVMDREADIYEVYSDIPNERTDIVIRNRHNRELILSNQKKTRIKDLLSSIKTGSKIEFYIKDKAGKKRKVKGIIKYTKANILRPKKKKKKEEYPSAVTVQIVEVKEVGNRKDKIHWILLSSIGIETVKDAISIVEIYRMRWQIEELFRLMKKESFDIESSELESGKSIRKLSILVMEAALRIQQLKTAREGDSIILTKEVFTEEEIESLRILNKNLQGATEKLKNPYEEKNLAWASWIIGRLGGWNGYKSQRPPGPITIKRGLERFEYIVFGQNILKDMYKP